METIVNALMLKAVDYQENDKILTLLTAEKGKLTAGIKGVRKGGAKLKFATQPFCFAEYVLAFKGGKYTVINATECESFYTLRTDINKFYAASTVIEVANLIANESEESSELFLECVNALSKMCNQNEEELLVAFLLSALRIAGYGINAENCPKCNKSLKDEAILGFDISSGSFYCKNCKGVGASRTTYNTIRKFSNKDFDPIHVTSDGLKRSLKLLKEYLGNLFVITPKSLTEYLQIIP